MDRLLHKYRGLPPQTRVVKELQQQLGASTEDLTPSVFQHPDAYCKSCHMFNSQIQLVLNRKVHVPWTCVTSQEDMSSN